MALGWPLLAVLFSAALPRASAAENQEPLEPTCESSSESICSDAPSSEASASFLQLATVKSSSMSSDPVSLADGAYCCDHYQCQSLYCPNSACDPERSYNPDFYMYIGRAALGICTQRATATTIVPTAAPTTTVRATTTAQKVGLSYVGCYADDASRDLPFGPGQSGGPKYTIQTCSDQCKGYKYFSLQFNGYCFCGNAYSTQAKYKALDDSKCGGSACTGEKASVSPSYCGGAGANAIYSFGTTTLAPTTTAAPTTTTITTTTTTSTTTTAPKVGLSYVGCYADDASRDLPFGPGQNGGPKYTIQTCSDQCKDYKYFSLQFNGYCFCGNSYSTQAKYKALADSKCGGSACTGEKASVSPSYCGGAGANAIYKKLR